METGQPKRSPKSIPPKLQVYKNMERYLRKQKGLPDALVRQCLDAVEKALATL